MSAAPDLAYDALGQGPPLYVLHGFLGAGENWRTVLKPFQAHFTVYYIDQRNHGRSPHLRPTDYPTLAADIYAFATRQGHTQVHLLGHSMGGKVAALCALTYPGRVASLVVVDMPLHGNEARHVPILEAMQGLATQPIGNRSEAAAYLEAHGVDPDTTQFLLKSYQRTPEGTYTWRVNLEGLVADYAHILAGIDDLPAVYEGPTAFVRGAESDYVTDTAFFEAQRQFPTARLFTVPNAGHWVHATNPRGFQAVFAEIYGLPMPS